MSILSYDLQILLSRLPLALAALILSGLGGLLIGPLNANANPALWAAVEFLFGGIGARLDRKQRAPADLMTRGVLLTGLVVIVAAAAGFGAATLSTFVMYRTGLPVMEILLFALALSGGAVWRLMSELRLAMTGGKGRYLGLARSSRTDLSGADNFAITRAAIAYAARNFDKGLVAPIFWYLIGGLPMAYVYAAVAALSWHFSRAGATRGFGLLPQALEMVLGFIPNVLSGILLGAAAIFTPSSYPFCAPVGLLPGKGRARYLQGGKAVNAVAWALKVTLGGPAIDLEARSLGQEWIGPAGASAQTDPAHLRRATFLIMVAWALLALSLGAGNMLTSSGNPHIFQPGLTHKLEAKKP